MVEEIEKSATTDNQSFNGDHGASRKDENPESGQIMENDDPSLAPLPSRTVTVQSSHPLEHSWTLWFDNPTGKNKQSTWGSSIRSIYTFSTVEEFWGLYNNIHHPSKLGLGSDFYCFKANIEPKWEDPVCANGGKWTMTFMKGKSDTPWLYTLLALIGEQFDHGDEICGAVVNIRPKDKISVWTKNGLNESAQMSIGEQWKKFIVYNDHIGFILHDDAKKDSRSAKNLYTL